MPEITINESINETVINNSNEDFYFRHEDVKRIYCEIVRCFADDFSNGRNVEKNAGSESGLYKFLRNELYNNLFFHSYMSFKTSIEEMDLNDCGKLKQFIEENGYDKICRNAFLVFFNNSGKNATNDNMKIVEKVLFQIYKGMYSFEIQ